MSGTESPSAAATRSPSSPSGPNGPNNSSNLERIHSSRFPDDYSPYHSPEEFSPDSLRREEEKPSEQSDTAAASLKEEQHGPGERRDGSDEFPVSTSADRDVELGSGAEKNATTEDPNLVTWDGPEDPANPKNWSFKTKWAATVVVSSFTFISPVSSSMIAPAVESIARDLGITKTVESQMVLSIFVLAYAIGPLVLGPLSEMYGRVIVLQLANAFFLAWNLGCGFAQTKSQLIAFRFLAGLGGSAPLAIGGGLLGDCWKAEERGKAISIYTLGPLLGPAVGPIAGGFIAAGSTWRWCFWSTSIFCAFIQFSGLFLLRETYAPKILDIKKNRLIKETGNTALYTEFDTSDNTLLALLRVSLTRPFRLLLTQPIVIIMSLYMAYLYGVMYLFLATFPLLWSEQYKMSTGTGSLNYIALGVGLFLGVQCVAPLNDVIYRRLKAKNGNVGLPEHRVPLMVPGALLTPIGIFWYGWSAQAKTHWIVPDIGAAIFSGGTIIGFQCIQTYLVDTYTRFAASAIAAVTVLRSVAGFSFPLFAPTMYDALDYGWGNTLLGFIAIAIGIPAPFMLWFYGGKLRAQSRFAAG